MRCELAALVLLALQAGCASAPDRAPISLDELTADAPAYVANRYAPAELPAALISDLTARGFACGHRAMIDECVFSERVFDSCFDVWTVRIDPAAPVHAERARRCLGANPPAQR